MLVLWTGKFTTQSRQTDQSRGLHIQTQRYEQEKVTQGGIHDPGATTTSHVSLEASALSGGVEFELKEAAGGHGLLSSEPSVGVATANGSAFIKAEGLNKAVPVVTAAQGPPAQCSQSIQHNEKKGEGAIDPQCVV